MKISLEKLPKNTTDYEMIWGALGALAILTARFVPFSLFPRLFFCPFRRLTGYPCFSCGMTRCFILMSHFDFKAGIEMNPLGGAIFIFTAVFVGYVIIAVLFKTCRIRIRITSKSEGNYVRIAVILIVFINWLYLIYVGS